jgi:hypothetical protein
MIDPPTTADLEAALEIAARRLLEADRVEREADDVASRARKEWWARHEDVVTLLQALRDQRGERGQRSAWLAPEGYVPPPRGHMSREEVCVTADGRPVSRRRLKEALSRLLALRPEQASPHADGASMIMVHDDA